MQNPIQLRLREDNCVLDCLLTSCKLLQQVVKVWAYTVEGQLPALVRRVEAALRMYSQDYVARCVDICALCFASIALVCNCSFWCKPCMCCRKLCFTRCQASGCCC